MMIFTLLLLCSMTQCLALVIINESDSNNNDNDSCPKIYWNDEIYGETVDTNSTWNVMLGDRCSHDGFCG